MKFRLSRITDINELVSVIGDKVNIRTKEAVKKLKGDDEVFVTVSIFYTKETIDNMFSDRDKKVLNLICEGKTSKEISSLLNVNIRTIEGQRADMLKRSECSNVAQLIRFVTLNSIV